MPFFPQALVNQHCVTGENPYWDGAEQSVYWVDIPPGKLFRLDTRGGAHELIYHDVPVGGFTRQSDGNWLLFRVRDIALMSPQGQVRSLLPFHDAGARRFNDVIADPRGRVFAGTIGHTATSGGLYRLDLDGQITQLWSGTGVANGMGFSPDERVFYWTCSTTNRIWAFDYDAHSAELSHRRLFYDVPDDEGIADGLTVDSRGHVWSARNGGYALIEHAPDGTKLGSIEFPIRKVNSLCFGGPKLDTLYVTTGGGAPDAPTADGTLYSLRVQATGKPEFLSRILL